MPAEVEAGARRVLSLLEPSIRSRLAASKSPAILGISGLQGSGKSTWASLLVSLLKSEYSLSAITVSLDDFYRPHDQLIQLRDDNPGNGLLRTRGQPGTHDEQLARKFLEDLKDVNSSSTSPEPLRIPVFDKSQFNGEGDRAPLSTWPTITPPVDVVIFEGWCVGFQPISSDAISSKHEAASKSSPSPTNTLPLHKLEHLTKLNENLERYCSSFMSPALFDFFLHLDTDDLANVYTWRLQQEHALIKAKGTGMSDQQVEDFIKGYMPGYELYLDGLRKGLFDSDETKMVRVLFGKGREILDVSKV